MIAHERLIKILTKFRRTHKRVPNVPEKPGGDKMFYILCFRFYVVQAFGIQPMKCSYVRIFVVVLLNPLYSRK